MSDGSINAVTFEQLIDKMREQAPLAGIREKQDNIVEFITRFEKQSTILPLIENITRQANTGK